MNLDNNTMSMYYNNETSKWHFSFAVDDNSKYYAEKTVNTEISMQAVNILDDPGFSMNAFVKSVWSVHLQEFKI